MKLKANFLVNKSIKSDRWPDYTDDRYQIRLPYLSEKFLVPTSSQRILTGSALISVCSIDLFVTQQSAQPLRRAVEQLARYFRREFHYDFCQYSADDDDPDHRLQFGHLHGFITLPDRRYASSGRSGLNHGRVADDVCWRALGERFGFDLLTQQCYEVLAGGSPSVRSPLG